MIKTEKIEKRYCDICKERKLNQDNLCFICGKDVCPYCRYSLVEYKRKYPNNGYLVSNKKKANMCIKCYKKLKNNKNERLK